MPHQPLGLKLALAGLSILAYGVIVVAAEWLETVPGLPQPGAWAPHAAAAVFGALVLGTYARAPWRWLRILVLAVVSAGIYYAAIRFVMVGLPGMAAATAFLLSGAGAAVLAALAVLAVAPAGFSARILPLAAAAGAIGGASFELRIASDGILLAGHAAWQFLVCLALHLGLAPASASSAS